MLPLNVVAMKSVRFIYVVATRCEQKVRNQFVEVWFNDTSDIENPVQVAKTIFKKQNWIWEKPFVIKVQTHEGDKTVHLAKTPWKEATHILRDAMRFRLLQNEPLHLRWDLKGLRDGIDFDKTRQNLKSTKLSWLKKGMLRTILCGACFTPARMMRAELLTQDQAVCVHCQQNVVESLGHRFWYCPAWQHIRIAFGLQNFSESSWPRALTRCGVCPAKLGQSAKDVKNIQLMMVEITASCAVAPLAQAQFLQGKRIRNPRTCLSLVQDLSGPQ